MKARFIICCGKTYKIWIGENDSNKLNVKDKTSESPLFECM
jgi:hypothetical protein